MGDRIEVAGAWQRVSMKYAFVEFIGTLIWGAILGASVGTGVYFIFGRELPLAGILAGGIFVFFVLLSFVSFRQVRLIGYLLRDDDLIVRRGMLWRRFVSVPYGRMQIVDITQGPLERMLGLRTLKFVTAAAASGVTIPGLPNDEAERLRDHLVKVAESRRAGL